MDLFELSNVYLYSEIQKSKRRKIQGYLIKKLGWPEKGSNFERKLGLLKHLFRIPIINQLLAGIGIRYLQNQGYDVLLLDLNGQIIGHTGFQADKNNFLHIFSIEVKREYQRKGLAKYMQEQIFIKARNKGIRKIRIGGGGDKIANKIQQSFAPKQKELRIIVQKQNWIEILD